MHTINFKTRYILLKLDCFFKEDHSTRVNSIKNLSKWKYNSLGVPKHSENI